MVAVVAIYTVWWRQHREEPQTCTRVTQDLTRSVVSPTHIAQSYRTRRRCTATSPPRYPELHSDMNATSHPQTSPYLATFPILLFATSACHFCHSLSRADPTASHGGPNAPLTVASCFLRGDLHQTPQISHNSRARSTNGCTKHDRGNHRGHFVVPPRHVRTTDRIRVPRRAPNTRLT